jgi:pimeloyl-ACP methyl ester carboxylesterase
MRLQNVLRQLIAALGASVSPQTLHKIPFLILGSEKDRLVDPQCSRDAAKALLAQLVMHPSAGHDLPLDDPDWVIEQIRNWLKSIGG